VRSKVELMAIGVIDEPLPALREYGDIVEL
jgi:hypothetical protein